jgi:hypothetical protein
VWNGFKKKRAEGFDEKDGSMKSVFFAGKRRRFSLKPE